MKKLLLIVSLLVSTIATEARYANNDPVVLDQTPILKYFPNPATSFITFDFEKGFEKGYTIQIYNFLGRKMVEQPLVSDQTTINLTDFTRGVYIFKVFDKTGRLVETGKFSVSK